jgi:HSP20 family protein
MSNIKKSETSFPNMFSDLLDYDRFFGVQPFKNLQNGFPAVNVKEAEKEYKIELAVPGFKKENIDVHLDNDILHISAESKNEKNEEDENFTRKEFSYNSFSRSFQLPQSANNEKIDAKYEDGILKIKVNKKEEAIKAETKKHISVN